MILENLLPVFSQGNWTYEVVEPKAMFCFGYEVIKVGHLGQWNEKYINSFKKSWKDGPIYKIAI